MSEKKSNRKWTACEMKQVMSMSIRDAAAHFGISQGAIYLGI